MLRNFLITGWRNLRKNKIFSAINIFGLSVGIAAFLLIVNYLRFEHSYDDFHVNRKNIYRVPMEIAENDGKEQTFAFTYPAVGPALKKDFPEVVEAVRFRRQGGIVKQGDMKIVEEGVMYADPAVFKLFTFSFIKGSAGTAFSGLNDAVITASTAKKYFGKIDPVGKTFNYRNEDYIVNAVMEDLPENSHIRFNILLNFNKYIELVKATRGDANGSWRWSDFYTYILLKPGTDPKALEAKLPAFTKRYLGDDMKSRGYWLSFAIQPLKDIHLRSKYDYEMTGNGNLTYLKYLGIAALFILFIAWINYVNLSTARSLDRSREVGIRKVVGANKFQLVRQFLAESFLLNTIAIILGVLIFKLSLPWFSTLVNKDLHSLNVSDWKFWVFAIAVFLCGSLLSAFYPSFVLSSFQPIQTIKNSSVLRSGKNYLRKSLVVLQFVAAIVLIAGATGFYRQLRYMQGRDLGVNIQQTMVLQQAAQQDSSGIPAFASFINDLKANPAINSVTASTSVPGSEVGQSASFELKNSTVAKRCRLLGVDKDFIPAYGLEIIEGRNFSNDIPASDTLVPVNMIVNETAARIFGFNKVTDIIGKELTGAGFNWRVIGVVKDYHQESLEHSFDPTVFYPDQESEFENFSLKFNTKDLAGLMAFVKQKWMTHFPESPYRYFFLDEKFNEQYKSDRLFATVLWLFTFVAISIACLGLFGLSLYTIAKRNKEISIRKVLGATVLQVASLVTRDYMKLVSIAVLAALPLAYFLVNNWLKKYAFRIGIGLWFFLLPVIMTLLIAMLTVLYQSLRAAIANPVKSLRTE